MISQEDIQIFKHFQRSPIFFINKMWGLEPPPLKEEYKEKAKVVGLKEFKADWFEPFIWGKHITWQQWIILLAVERSLRGAAPKRVSVKSGHGIGKSAVLSWLILWYLFCFKDSQIPATAPTSEQIHDILWKEIKVWLDRMPQPIQAKYEWTTGYVRITESPETWFARARTAKKENPEALAGVHGDFVFICVDEASGVANEIFKPAEGSLTNENVLVVLISNPRRLIGYFYDTHHSDKFNWQTLSFSSVDSPIVELDFVERIIAKYGAESDEYNYMVAGNFPKEDTVDEKGYVPLLVESDLKFTTDDKFIGEIRLGIDPAGAGKNKTSWVARDKFKQKVMAKEKISTGKGIAQKTITLCDFLGIKKQDAKKRITVDSFGEGTEAIKELALAGWNVYSVNVGEQPEAEEDKKLYLNKKAMAYDREKKWLRSGGELVNHEDWKPQLLAQRYRRELSGKMKMMPKEDLAKSLEMSGVDTAEASMLNFVLPEEKPIKEFYQKPYQPMSSFEGV